MKKLKYIVIQALEALHLRQEYNVSMTSNSKNHGPIENIPIVKKRNSFELISLHIPKSAGTSFYKILQGVYGNKYTARVDYKPHFNKLLINTRAFNKEEFPDHIKVIHGHIRYKALKEHIVINEDAKVLTWMRNPVERVISDYYYVSGLLAERYNKDPYNPNILKRMSKTLLEFASSEVERNRMSKFLGEINLEDLYFVGVLEYFKEDLEYLSGMLGWKSYSMAKVNKTKNKVENIPHEIYERIKELNNKDMELYEKALLIRKNRNKHKMND